MSNVKLLFLTHHPFWLMDTGARNRAAAIWEAIAGDSRFKPIIGYQRLLNANDREAIRIRFPDMEVIDLPRVKGSIKESDIPALARSSPLFKNHFNLNVWSGFRSILDSHKPDIVFSTYLADLPYFTKDKSIKKVIDTNDIVSLRSMAFRRMKQPVSFSLTFEAEANYLKQFDLAIAIQDMEYSTLCSMIGADRSVYLPFTFGQIDPLPLSSDPGLRVLFPASHQPPNVDGLFWFLDNVWPYFSGSDSSLIVTGTIERAIGQQKIQELQQLHSNIQFKGVVEDLRNEYEQSNVIINPVFYGSGMKIKSIEALKYGRCLVTTKVGAEGLSAGNNAAFQCVESAVDFISVLHRLKQDVTEVHRTALEGLKLYHSLMLNDCFMKYTLDLIFDAASLKGN